MFVYFRTNPLQWPAQLQSGRHNSSGHQLLPQGDLEQDDGSPPAPAAGHQAGDEGRQPLTPEDNSKIMFCQ